MGKGGDKIKLSLKQSKLFALLGSHKKISYDMNHKNNINLKTIQMQSYF